MPLLLLSFVWDRRTVMASAVLTPSLASVPWLSSYLSTELRFET